MTRSTAGGGGRIPVGARWTYAPGGSVSVIDPGLIGDPDDYVPGEAVQGVRRVGEDGTGEFVPDPRYGPPEDDFAELTESRHWLDRLGEQPAAGDADRMIVTRAAVALSFALSVTGPGGRREVLQGVFSWVAVGLDRPGERQDQVWFDLRAGLDRAEADLRERIRLGGRAPEPDTP